MNLLNKTEVETVPLQSKLESRCEHSRPLYLEYNMQIQDTFHLFHFCPDCKPYRVLKWN